MGENFSGVEGGAPGGPDSTHALTVAAKACDRLGLPRTHILAFTLPGFATSSHTKNNASLLAEALGVPGADLRLFGKPEGFTRRRMADAVATGFARFLASISLPV